MKTFSLVLLSLLIGLLISDRSIAEVYTTGSAADNDGNIIVVGYCLGNVRIMGQEYSFIEPAAFVVKLDQDGELIWIKLFQSTYKMQAKAIAVDDWGNIYVPGEFNGTAIFDSFSLTSTNLDAFILKLDPAGNVKWVKHGKSQGVAGANDISRYGDLLYVCGYGQLINYDSLTTTGGYTLILNTSGVVQSLFRNFNSTFIVRVDHEGNAIVYTQDSGSLGTYHVQAKYSSTGVQQWAYLIVPFTVPFGKCIDPNNNIFSASTLFGLTFYFNKKDPDGNIILSQNFGPTSGHSAQSMIYSDSDELIAAGFCSNGLVFGNTTIASNGLRDACVAKLDTNLNPIWITSGGGLYNDEFNSVSALSNGTIYASGNFRGSITFGSVNITGGSSTDDLWCAAAKFDNNGNLLWLKKIAENFIMPVATSWFPLEVGNKAQYFAERKPYGVDYFLNLFHITDSVNIFNKKYYSADGFLSFNSSTRIRYDDETQRLFVFQQGQEYLFMDFSMVGGETFQQIQSNGSMLNTTVISATLVILEDTLEVKGFHNVRRIVYPWVPIISIYSWVYFAPGIGLVFQDEECNNSSSTDLYLIEYLINDDGLSNHKKHTETATLLFEPVTFIVEGNYLLQNFIVLHPFSKQNFPASSGFFSYINTHLESFYFNGTDTIWNPQFNIQQTSEIDFSLNYQFDTTKYQQGYHLYYRIAAVDKGIIADTFYSPQEGFYKLFWKDSTTSVTQLSPLVYDYSLSQNYPNPFNPSSKIVFTIPERNFVSLKVFDVLGSEISSLVNEELDSGRYEVEFSGNDLSSGIYIYQIRAGSFIDTKKMILLR